MSTAPSSRDPLPPGWEEVYDEQYKTYYYYAASSQTSTWEKPTEPAPGIGSIPTPQQHNNNTQPTPHAVDPEPYRQPAADYAPRDGYRDQRGPVDPRGRVDSRGRDPRASGPRGPGPVDPRPHPVDPRSRDPRGPARMDPRGRDPRNYRADYRNVPPSHMERGRGGGSGSGGGAGAGGSGDYRDPTSHRGFNDYRREPQPVRNDYRDVQPPQGKRNHDTYAKIFVGGLSFDTSKQAIGDTFSRMGRVREVIIVVDKHTRRPKGYAFVTFEHENSAVRALREMQGYELDGRALRVELSGERHDGGGEDSRALPYARGPGQGPGGPHGPGGPDQRQQQVSFPSDDPRNEPIRGSRGRIREDLQDVTDHSIKSMQIYVGSLNYEMRDEHLRETFEKCGEISEATVLMDRANPTRSRGYGFITFKSAVAARKAIDLFDNAMVRGRRITVRENTARRLERKGGGPGRGGSPPPQQQQRQQQQQQQPPSNHNNNGNGRERSRSRERR